MQLLLHAYHASKSAAAGIQGALLLDGQEELELRWELLFAVQAVREVDAADAAVGVDLDT
jgi:hypothetical protein